MIYQTYTPPPPLDGFIENLWYWEGDAPGHTKDTIMASSRMSLLINLRHDRLSWYGGENFGTHSKLRGIALSGNQSGAFAINADQPHMMGVQFHPGGAFPFLGMPASEFFNNHVSLEDVWGSEAGRLHERLVQTPTVADRFEILERALIALAVDRLERHPAVALALQRLHSAAPVSIASLAAEAEISHKKFIRLFTAEIGMSPKICLRILRFQRLLRGAWFAENIDWAQMAAEYGYYDQPHLIRDFKAFSGFTPRDWQKRRGPHLQHVPLME